MYFEGILALLLRCNDNSYAVYLTVESRDIALSLRAAILKLHGLTENSDWLTKLKAFTEFESFYARVRHSVNGLHHVYEAQLRNSAGKNLLELLYQIGFLEAWNFTDSDLTYLNIIRVLGKEIYPLFLAHTYKFMDNGATITGILPLIDEDTCSGIYWCVPMV